MTEGTPRAIEPPNAKPVDLGAGVVAASLAHGDAALLSPGNSRGILADRLGDRQRP